MTALILIGVDWVEVELDVANPAKENPPAPPGDLLDVGVDAPLPVAPGAFHNPIPHSFEVVLGHNRHDPAPQEPHAPLDPRHVRLKRGHLFD